MNLKSELLAGRTCVMYEWQAPTGVWRSAVLNKMIVKQARKKAFIADGISRQSCKF